MRQKLLCIAAFFLISGYSKGQDNVFGKVVDAQSKELLGGVNIYVLNSGKGTVSNLSTGGFSLSLSHDADTLIVSYVGYKKQKINVRDLKRDKELTIKLTPSFESLQSIIVSASREQQLRSEAALAISTLSSQQLHETKATFLTEAINKVPGVLMVNLGNEQHAMSIRQPMSYRGYFLYLEDGLPIRPAGLFNHNALIEVNMFSLRSVEVMRGPASSIYGSESIGGAINFITNAPSYEPSATVGTHGDQWGYRRVQFNAGTFVTNKLGIAAGGYVARQRDSWQGHSDFDKLSLNLRADYLLNSNTRIIATVSKNKLDSEMGGSLDSIGFYGKAYNSLHTFTYRKVNALRARVTLQKFWQEGSETNITTFFRNNSIEQIPSYSIRNIWNDRLRANGEQNINSFRSYGILAQHSQKLNFMKSKLIYGLYSDLSPSYYNAHYLAVHRNEKTGVYSGYTPRADSLLTDYNAVIFNNAVYAQFEINPTERLKLIAGARHDRVDYLFDNHLSPSAFSGSPDDKRFFGFFTPKLGMTYDLAKDIGLYVNYSKGAYAPGINELYRGVKIPSLQHASFDNYEAGIWAPLFNKKLNAEVCIYRMAGRNEIVTYILEDNSRENRNSGRTLHQGLEYSFTYVPVKEWHFRFGGTNAIHRFIQYSTRNENDFSGNMMPNAPEWIANSEITYRPRFLKGLRAAIEWQRVSSWLKDDANLFRYDDRTLFNLKGISVLNFRTGYYYKGCEIYLNVMNLSNEHYAHNATRGAWGDVFNPAAGRTVAMGVSYNISGNKSE